MLAGMLLLGLMAGTAQAQGCRAAQEKVYPVVYDPGIGPDNTWALHGDAVELMGEAAYWYNNVVPEEQKTSFTNKRYNWIVTYFNRETAQHQACALDLEYAEAFPPGSEAREQSLQQAYVHYQDQLENYDMMAEEFEWLQNWIATDGY